VFSFEMQLCLFVAQKLCSGDDFKQNAIMFATVSFCGTGANSSRLLQRVDASV
jgi:hypothetical protein